VFLTTYLNGPELPYDLWREALSGRIPRYDLASFAGSLGQLGRPVVDRTGLTGRFDFEIEWAPEPNGPPSPDVGAVSDSSGPLIEALHDQLRLKLESTRGPIETLVVDHIERPSEN
jgi:uncharacterized protein (TIGR03435 family)